MKTGVKITSINPDIVNNIENVIGNSFTQRSVLEQQVYDAYIIQNESLSSIKTNWPGITKFTYNDIMEILTQYNLYKELLTKGGRIQLLSTPSACNNARNEAVNGCFSYFVFDVAECWLIGSPGCYYKAVKDQYRCNASAEATYRSCSIK